MPYVYVSAAANQTIIFTYKKVIYMSIRKILQKSILSYNLI